MMPQDDEWAVERRLDEIAAIRIAGYQRLARDKWLSPAAEVVDDIPAYATDEQAVYHLEDTVERTGRAAAYLSAVAHAVGGFLEARRTLRGDPDPAYWTGDTDTLLAMVRATPQQRRNAALTALGIDGVRVEQDVQQGTDSYDVLVPVPTEVLSAPLQAAWRQRVAGTLTPHQQTMLVYAAQGATTDEIARMLHLSPQTIKNHFTAIYRKLGVSGRPQAVAYVVAQGWVVDAGSTDVVTEPPASGGA